MSLLTQKAPELRQLTAVNGGQEPRVFGGEDAVNLSTVAISGNCPMSGADQLIDCAGVNYLGRYLMLPIRAFSISMRHANPASARLIAWLYSVRSRQ